MIDYIKISLINIDVNRLENLLDFKTLLSERTGELSSKKVAEHHFCKVTIYDSKLVLFTGSIHKMYNSLKGIEAPNYQNVKGFNGNQFRFAQIDYTIGYLTKLFDCTAEQMVIQNIEFGINTKPKFDPQLFIKGLLYHNGKPFEFRHNKRFAQVPHQRYFMKIYNKSQQYKMDAHTLRVELKIIKTEYIRDIGINTLADIKNETLLKAKEILLKRFSEVVYYDYTINKELLKQSQLQTLKDYANPNFWIIELAPRNRVYNRKKLQNYITQYSNNLQQVIAQEIDEKFGISNQQSESSRFGISNHSSIEVFIPNKQRAESDSQKERICPITRLDIAMQM